MVSFEFCIHQNNSQNKGFFWQIQHFFAKTFTTNIRGGLTLSPNFPYANFFSLFLRAFNQLPSSRRVVKKNVNTQKLKWKQNEMTQKRAKTARVKDSTTKSWVQKKGNKNNWFNSLTHRTTNSFMFHRLIDEAIEAKFRWYAGRVCISTLWRLIALWLNIVGLDVATRLELTITILDGAKKKNWEIKLKRNILIAFFLHASLASLQFFT